MPQVQKSQYRENLGHYRKRGNGMNLWIKTQNKEGLFEIAGISYGNHCKKHNIFGSLKSNSLTREILGEYPTRERCLEIIDEIQNILRRSGMILFKDVDITNLSPKDIEPFKAINWRSSPIENEKSEVTVHNMSVVVYEMPEN